LNDKPSLPSALDIAWQKEQRRRIRQTKVEHLLESVDLTPEEFILWLQDNGIEPHSTEIPE
jgi:sulfur carrier protein ThiS